MEFMVLHNGCIGYLDVRLLVTSDHVSRENHAHDHRTPQLGRLVHCLFPLPPIGEETASNQVRIPVREWQTGSPVVRYRGPSCTESAAGLRGPVGRCRFVIDTTAPCIARRCLEAQHVDYLLGAAASTPM